MRGGDSPEGALRPHRTTALSEDLRCVENGKSDGEAELSTDPETLVAEGLQPYERLPIGADLRWRQRPHSATRDREHVSQKIRFRGLLRFVSLASCSLSDASDERGELCLHSF